MNTRAISVVETTSSDLEVLRKMASHLIEQRFAACVQILPPHHSIYRWDGKVVESTEYRLQAKTILEQVPVVMETIKNKHNYELPEIAHVSVNVNEEYAQWLVHEITD